MTENKIQFVDLGRQYKNIQDEVDKAISIALARGDYILGEDTKRFEFEFAQYLKGSHDVYCVGVGDGTDALHLGLLALGIGAGDEVIVPANTFIASVLAISVTGARPVLVDCDPDFFTMDVSKIENAITSRTKAIMPVHLYGQPCDMDSIKEISKRHGLRIIEDCAQAHGAEYKGTRCGLFGDIGCFSFYPGKNLGAYGDGGAIVCQNSELHERLTLLRNYGQRKKYVHDVIGYNSRLDTIQAAILRVKLRHLDEWNTNRAIAANWYLEKIKAEDICLPKTRHSVSHVWHLFVVQVSNRQEVQHLLSEEGIATGIHYPIPIHLQKAYEFLGYGIGDFPVTEKLSQTILSLPMFPEISEDEVTRIAAVLNR